MDLNGRIIDCVIPISRDDRLDLISRTRIALKDEYRVMRYTGVGNASNLEMYSAILSNWNILQLPVHILIHILEYSSYGALQYIKQLMSVCKLFRKILLDRDNEGFYHRIHLKHIYLMNKYTTVHSVQLDFINPPRNVIDELKVRKICFYNEEPNDIEYMCPNIWMNTLSKISFKEVHLDAMLFNKPCFYLLSHSLEKVNGDIPMYITIYDEDDIMGHTVPEGIIDIKFKTTVGEFRNTYKLQELPAATFDEVDEEESETTFSDLDGFGEFE